jgi:purine-binding chemotaxis protein CheW
MMTTQAYYLNFVHNQLRYAVPATAVQEVFFLPELYPLPEGPEDIIGTVNVRGEILPVMDLNRRFGYAPQDYRLTDSIVVLRWQELHLGILTEAVQSVQAFEADTIVTELAHDHPFLDLKQNRFLEGYYPQDDGLVLILNLEKLLRYVEDSEVSFDLDLFSLDEAETLVEDGTAETVETPPAVKHPLFWPQASDYERKVLHQRADSLRQSLKLKDQTGLKPIAIFSFYQERFALELSTIQEFIKFQQITPIPCTPNFIVGNINLRGEVITLIDIRGLFNLTLPLFKPQGQAMIVRVGDIVAGVLIDTIQNIILYNPKDLVTDQGQEQEINAPFLQGILPYQDTMIGLIDLATVMEEGGLCIDEAV